MGKNNRRKTTEEVAAILAEEEYQLLSKYKNARLKLKVRCPINHEYEVAWFNFKSGDRCPKCRKVRQQKDEASLVREIAQVGYTFVNKRYRIRGKKRKRKNLEVRVICPRQHMYWVNWGSFQRGTKCAICHGNKKKNLREIRKEIGAEKYKVISTKYVNSESYLEILCPKEHQYQVTWTNWQQKHRCPQCFPRQSKREKEIVHIFSSYKVKESVKGLLINKRKELDLYFPDHQVAIEYCGLYWHSDQHDRITPRYHRDKMDECQAQGIHLLTIFEDEWILHKDICISRINNALGICPNRIYARKCEARQIDKKEAKEFLNRVHLQGYGRCKLAFGLYYQGNLVQVMTWGSPARAHTAKGKKVLEMKRFASELNTVVVGGAGKLFKFGLAYAKQEGYNSLKSYCDLRWGTGNLYAKLGFTKTYETRYTPHYTDGVNRYRNQVLAQNKNKTGKTEAEVAMEKGLWKIYDCGHSTWEYRLKCIDRTTILVGSKSTL